MLFLHFTGASTEIRVEPLENVINSLWSGNDVERWGDRATVLKIGNPQFTSGKFPFCVGSFLCNSNNHKMMMQFFTKILFLEYFLSIKADCKILTRLRW